MKRPDDSAALRLIETEQIRPELSNLDQLSIEDLIDLMCSDVQRVHDALDVARLSIGEAVAGIVKRLERGGRLIYVGAGTAGRLGMLDAAEAGPTFNVEVGQVVGVLAGGVDALGVAAENAEDDYDAGAKVIEDLAITEADCVVGISASGRTPYVLGAIDAAKSVGALSVGLACNATTPLTTAVEFPIEVVVGPELIAGSTRMNSGTAQKIVLNIISTASMVQLGKTYGNLMVDLRPTNEKLRERALRIVSEIADASAEDAQRALEASGWKTKVATAMLVGHVDSQEAARQLERHGGRLRPTLDDLRSSPSRASFDHGGQGWTRLGVAAALVNGGLVAGDVAVRDGLIVALGLSNPGTGIAIAGFIDAQINGFGGVDILNAGVDDLIAMGEALANDGIVAYQPTLITSELEQIEQAGRRISEARSRQSRGATILGIHLEGPFLSRERSGTHPVKHLRQPDASLLEELLRVGEVLTVTLAPELPGALDLIRLCRQRGVNVSLGHSAATSEEAQLGFDAGASSVTHLFNAMEPLSARRPGLAGAALARGGVTVQIIADGVHVSDEMITMSFGAAAGRCVLVSDMIAAAGCAQTTVQLGEVTVHVSDGVARRSDGTIAGSIGTLPDGVHRLARLGISPIDALNAATWRPARMLGATSLVDLRPGASATLWILDDELRLSRRFDEGREVEVPSR